MPAYELLESEKVPNDRNNYQAYIEIAEKKEIDSQSMQDFMDYQTMTDFIISNTDELQHGKRVSLYREKSAARA